MTDVHFWDKEKAAEFDGVIEGLVDGLRERYVWDEVPCVLCGPGVGSSYVTTKVGIDLRRCDSCGHLFVSPRLPEEAVAELYGATYWDEHARAVGSPTLEERAEFDYQNGFGKLRRDVIPFARGKTLFDVGASNGGMVRAARESGFEATGNEPSADICALAKRVNGVDLLCGDVRTLPVTHQSFAVVTMHDVLEHLFDPIGTLEACRRILATGGLLVVETPTTESIELLLLGDDWSQLNPLGHVNLFSEAGAAEALARTGFRIVDLYDPHENNVILIGEAA